MNLIEENKRLKNELKVWINICQTLEEIQSNLVSKMSLMKFECPQSQFQQLIRKYQSLQRNIVGLNNKYTKYKQLLNQNYCFNTKRMKCLQNSGNESDITLNNTQINDDFDEMQVSVYNNINNNSLIAESNELSDKSNDNLDKQLRDNSLNLKKRLKSKALVCDYFECKQRFYKESILEAHKRMHLSGYSYSCEWPGCGHTFIKRHHYIKHRRRHSDEGIYLCHWPGCQYRSHESSAIKNHNRVHTNERPFQCSHCQMKFKIKQHLKKHELQHTGEKPFQCDWLGCDRRFTTISYMRSHKKKRHSL